MVNKFSSSKKAKSEKGGAATEAKYTKLDKGNEAEQLDDYGDESGFDDYGGSSSKKLKKGKRDHEIYKDTYYLPNDKLRLLEIPMNSSLTFQMMLYYHTFYNILYAFLLVPTGIYKMFLGRKGDVIGIVGFITLLLYIIFEPARLNFGYKGNINESFPELIAFLIQTILFSFAFTVVPYMQDFKLPHEEPMYIINLMFMICEVIIGIYVMKTFSKT